MAYSLETLERIYDDSTGGYIEVRPSCDGIPDILDIRAVEGNKEYARLSISMDQARLLVDAIKRFTDLV